MMNTATTAWGTRMGARMAYSRPPRVLPQRISAMLTSTPRMQDSTDENRAMRRLTHTALRKSARVKT